MTHSEYELKIQELAKFTPTDLTYRGVLSNKELNEIADLMKMDVRHIYEAVCAVAQQGDKQ